METTPVTVHAQYIRDFSFESPNAPQIFSEAQAQPQIHLGVNVQTRKLEEALHESLLLLKLEATAGEKTVFIAELAYGGLFGVAAMPDEQLKAFLLVEAPRLLFPFARSILACAIQDGGFPQVLLNPIDFAALYQQQRSQAPNEAAP